MKKFIAIGEILWDVFPSHKVWGGAPANAIFYAQQLGVDAAMLDAGAGVAAWGAGGVRGVPNPAPIVAASASPASDERHPRAEESGNTPRAKYKPPPLAAGHCTNITPRKRPSNSAKR